MQGCLPNLASVLGPHLRPSQASFLGRQPSPSEESAAQQRAHLRPWLGLHREAWGQCAQLALQLAGMAGGRGWDDTADRGPPCPLAVVQVGEEPTAQAPASHPSLSHKQLGTRGSAKGNSRGGWRGGGPSRADVPGSHYRPGKVN